jgi:hypothetical protein
MVAERQGSFHITEQLIKNSHENVPDNSHQAATHCYFIILDNIHDYCLICF